MAVLPWLPSHIDPGGAIRALRALPAADRLDAVVALCGHARDAVLTNRIDRLLADTPRDALAPVRLALLGSHTLDHLSPAIRVAGAARGMDIAVHSGEYGQYRQDLLGGDPALDGFAPQLVLLALDLDAVVPRVPTAASRAQAVALVDQAVDGIRQLWRQARVRYGAQPVQQTFLCPSPPLVGCNETLLPASPHSLCMRLNAALREAALEDGALLLDVAEAMPPVVDGAPRLDPVRWHQAKQLINPLLAPLYGDLVARVAAAVMGKSRKCLVLDLDNTLWGGVIGDDGIAGVRLGQGSAEGEAFLAFQRYVARLAERGVVIAVCSKNDHAVAQAMFEGHPEMQIAYADVASFVANWQDKATNLRHIARTVNLGLDALVFVDDNPAERAIVRRELPQVAVPELPDDVAFYPERLAQAGYFEAAALTADDFARTQSYAANTLRAAANDEVTDMDGYLASLKMVLSARSLTPVDLPRCAQLINKSNQFNLTTVRRTEAELAQLVAEPATLALALRLSDGFGDSGLISVILARPDPAWEPAALLIDTWLMSCRVLGRGVAAAALGVLIDAARARGISALIGEYRPSGRNAMVEQHYARLGFEPCDGAAPLTGGVCFWRLPLAGAVAPLHHILVETADDAGTNLCGTDARHA